MVVNVRLATNDAPLIRAAADKQKKRSSLAFRQFGEGLFLGFIVSASAFAVYWLISTYYDRIPGWQSIYMKYLLAFS